MHEKALNLLKDLSADEDDKLDKLGPTIRYLQKLGPSHLNLIFSSSKWLFSADAPMALQVFTADEAEVEALPRHEVLRFLEGVDRRATIGYLEHILDVLGEAGPDFHDKLGELYLAETKARGSKGMEAGKGGG